jgi:hypothetical protein
VANLPIQVELIRVHTPGGAHDYTADDFDVNSRGGLTLWRELANGSRQTVAAFSSGQFLRVERVPAGTPLPERGPFVA